MKENLLSTALDVRDRSAGQANPLSELILGEPQPLAMMAHKPAEGRVEGVGLHPNQ